MSVTGTAGGRIAPGVGANLIGQHAHDRNQDATVYVGNLDPQVHLTVKAAVSKLLAQAWLGMQ
jgi:splicing factor 3B subunit 4